MLIDMMTMLDWKHIAFPHFTTGTITEFRCFAELMGYPLLLWDNKVFVTSTLSDTGYTAEDIDKGISGLLKDLMA